MDMVIEWFYRYMVIEWLYRYMCVTCTYRSGILKVYTHNIEILYDANLYEYRDDIIQTGCDLFNTIGPAS